MHSTDNECNPEGTMNVESKQRVEWNINKMDFTKKDVTLSTKVLKS